MRQPATSSRRWLAASSGNVGVFECDDHFEGQPIRVQYQWTRVDANHARWQQSFLPNGSNAWEANWTAEFARKLA
jgi:hypothetical protein